MVEEEEKFDNVIFTDESTFQVEYYVRRAYRRLGEPRILRQKPKHPAKVHVWAGISKRGATNIVLFYTNLTATRYTTILDAAFVPFVQSCFGGSSYRLFQDNDPKHTSRWTQWYIDKKHINWWRTPQESPHANAIELLWRTMKEAVRNTYKPRTIPQLKDSIKDYCTRRLLHQSAASTLTIFRE